MAAKDFTVRVGEEEIGQILNRKENLDHHGQLWESISRYRALGWDLAVITAQGGADLGLDLKQPREICWKQLADLGLDGLQLNLAIRTGRPSRLLVLEVNKGEGTLSLDLLGDWRSQCVAELGNSREQHYYTLPEEGPTPLSHFMAREVLIYADEGLVLAPPSIEPDAKEPWCWVKPPWESPPREPKPAVWQFLREQTGAVGPTGAAGPAGPGPGPEIPSWDDVYRVVARHGMVLKALLGPPASMEIYYRDILTTALAAGLRDRQVLLGLLWHAPHGDARRDGARWQSLQQLVSQALGSGGAPLTPAPVTGAAIWGPVPAPALVGAPVESLDLALGVGEMTRQLLGDHETESSPARFEKTVSGQFFQLLASLGERVITESCRNEALFTGIGAQATEMERLAGEIEQCLAAPGSGNAKALPAPPAERGPAEFPWAGAITPQPQKSRRLQEVKATVQEFLNANPDLAEDRNRVQMVLFSLKNYVSINPENAGLSFREKLEKAGQMARSFLGQGL